MTLANQPEHLVFVALKLCWPDVLAVVLRASSKLPQLLRCEDSGSAHAGAGTRDTVGFRLQQISYQYIIKTLLELLCEGLVQLDMGRWFRPEL